MNEARKIDLVVSECRCCLYNTSSTETPGRFCIHEKVYKDDTDLWWLDDNNEYVLDAVIRIPDWCPLKKE